MSNKSILDRRTRTRTEVAEQRKHLVDAAEAEQRTTLTAGESAAHRAFTEQLAGLDERIADLTAEVERAGTGLPRGGPASQDTTTRRWADNAVRAIRAMSPEGRAVVSGSVDVPQLVLPTVVANPRPLRLLDVVINRIPVEPAAGAAEYFKQTARTTNPNVVADLGSKPTSTYSVAGVQDRCRVVAHLSDYVPLRIWENNQAVSSWLSNEMTAGRTGPRAGCARRRRCPRAAGRRWSRWPASAY
jgi:hypothetical protein